MKRKKSSRKWTTHLTSRALFKLSLGILILSVMVLCLALLTERNDDQEVKAQKPFTAGQTFSMGSAELKISGVSYTDGDKAFAAPAGQHYLIFDLYVRNISDKPIQVLPSSDTYIKDSDGNVTYLTPYVLPHPFHAGELLPGDNVNGQLSFLVSKTGNYKLYIDSVWSGGVLPIQI